MSERREAQAPAHVWQSATGWLAPTPPLSEPAPIPAPPAVPFDDAPRTPPPSGSTILPGPHPTAPTALNGPPAQPPPGAETLDMPLIPPAPGKVIRSAVAMRVIGATGAPVPATATNGLYLTEQDVLPHLDGDGEVSRPWWRKKVFIASVTIALVAAIATPLVLRWQETHRPLTEVKNLSLVDLGPTYELIWNGPDDVAYQLIATNRAGEDPHDASMYIRGKLARIPTTTPTLDERTCFIVRSQDAAAYYKVSTTDEDLKEQGAQMTCVTDTKKH